eukprot:TRINITY_DN4110_c0_g1_i1.p1 TRINITY_DN4110_c0_g1~~TRINITY_DN4110_c0_g1_i1.p1  ORF type:complete len:105 (-),score=27.03 TRINITY_DN4110_c0_g1_i1:320-607(-)
MEARVSVNDSGAASGSGIVWQHSIAYDASQSLSTLCTALEQLRKDSNEALSDLMLKHSSAPSAASNPTIPAESAPSDIDPDALSKSPDRKKQKIN